MRDIGRLLKTVVGMWLTGMGVLLIITWIDRGYAWASNAYGKGSNFYLALLVVGVIFIPLIVGYMVMSPRPRLTSR